MAAEIRIPKRLPAMTVRLGHILVWLDKATSPRRTPPEPNLAGFDAHKEQNQEWEHGTRISNHPDVHHPQNTETENN